MAYQKIDHMKKQTKSVNENDRQKRISYFHRPLCSIPKKLKWNNLSILGLNYNGPSKDGPPSWETNTTKKSNNQLSRYSQLNSGSPLSIEIWVNTKLHAIYLHD